jgi:hypothetical protein
MKREEKLQHLTAFTIPGKGKFHWITTPFSLFPEAHGGSASQYLQHGSIGADPHHSTSE